MFHRACSCLNCFTFFSLPVLISKNSLPKFHNYVICVTDSVYMHTNILPPPLLKRQYSDKATSMAYDNENSTINTVYMQLCAYSEYCTKKRSDEFRSFFSSSSAKIHSGCSCCVPSLQLFPNFCIIIFLRAILLKGHA